MSPEPTADWPSIVDRHAERVFRIAYRILGSVHDAEDVSQNVFTEAIRLRTAGPIQSWSGLFTRLATLRALDLLRQRRKTVELAEGDGALQAGPPELAAAAELSRWIRDAVATLPDQQAAVFSLVCFGQLDRSEAAAILGLTPETVSTNLYKARRRLQGQMTTLFGGTER